MILSNKRSRAGISASYKICPLLENRWSPAFNFNCISDIPVIEKVSVFIFEHCFNSHLCETCRHIKTCWSYSTISQALSCDSRCKLFMSWFRKHRFAPFVNLVHIIKPEFDSVLEKWMSGVSASAMKTLRKCNIIIWTRISNLIRTKMRKFWL